MSLKAEIKITDGGGNVVGVVDVDMAEANVFHGIPGGIAENMVTDPETGKVHSFKFESKVAGQVAPKPPAQELHTEVHGVAPAEFKVGDQAIVTVGNSPFVPGDTVTVLEPLDRDGHYWCEGRGGHGRRYVDQSQLRPVKAPEVPVAEFKVGDWVRFTSDDMQDKGSLGRIKYGLDSDGDYGVNFGTEWNYVAAEDIEPAGDFRVGDKVRIVESANAIHYLAVGSVAEVIDAAAAPYAFGENSLYVLGVDPDTKNPLKQIVNREDVEYAL